MTVYFKDIRIAKSWITYFFYIGEVININIWKKTIFWSTFTTKFYYVSMVFLLQCCMTVSCISIIRYFKRTEDFLLPGKYTILHLCSISAKLGCRLHVTFILLKMWQGYQRWLVMLQSYSVRKRKEIIIVKIQVLLVLYLGTSVELK